MSSKKASDSSPENQLESLKSRFEEMKKNFDSQERMMNRKNRTINEKLSVSRQTPRKIQASELEDKIRTRMKKNQTSEKIKSPKNESGLVTLDSALSHRL